MAAVGAITASHNESRTIRRYSMAWTSSSDTGAVSGIESEDLDGELLAVVFTPGSGGTQPSDQYDVTLLDDDGFDALQGKGANRSNVTATMLTPLIGDGTTTNQRVPLSGTYQLTVAAAGNSKTGTVTLYYR